MWGWVRPSRNLPRVNYNEGSSEEEEFDSPLASPRRPVTTREGSPQPLAVPTLADNVDEDLEQVRQALQNVGHTHTFRDTRPTTGAGVRVAANDNRDVVSEEVVDEGLVFEVADLKVGADNANDDDNGGEIADENVIMPDVVNFDAEDKEDGADAATQARHIKVEFDPADVRFWFAQLEDEMVMAGVNRQWLKKTILQRNLPVKQKEDVKSYFTLQKADAGAHIYLDIKKELIRIYAAKPCDSYRKALSRTMTGLPSQLGYQIVDDICKKSQKLVGCCCPAAALALWTDKLPVNVREHISNEEFTAETYKAIFNAADKVFLSGRPSQVAAVSSLNETLPAFNPHNQPSAEVAAIAGNNNKNNRGGARGSGRGGRGGRGNRGGGQQRGGNSNRSGTSRGTKHASIPDNLANKMCDRHYVHGDQAWYCLAPLTCPWKDKCIGRQ